MRFSKSLLIAAIASVIPVMSHASPVPVSWNPSLSVDGLDFGDFSCAVTKGGIYATPSHCSQIKVGTITSPGVGIQITSGFTAAPFSFDDVDIDYNVSSSKAINSVGLDFNGTFWGYAISSVTESVYSGETLVGFAQVGCGALIGCTRTDTIQLDGAYNNLYIEKDISVSGFLGIAQASIVDQTFGTDASAPEPSSLGLIGSGLLATAALVRRRMKLGMAKKADSQA